MNDEEEVLIDLPEDEDAELDDGLLVDEDLGLGLDDELDDDLDDLGLDESFGDEDEDRI